MLTTIKKGLVFLMASVSVSSVLAAKYMPYEQKGPVAFWEVKGGLGYSLTNKFLDQVDIVNTLVSTDHTVTNQLQQESQSTSPLFYLSLQKTWILDKPAFYALSVGPTFYYQAIQSKGSGNRADLPSDISHTFNYTFNNSQFLLMMELQWTPVLLAKYFAPYVVLGAGLNSQNLVFNVTPVVAGSPMPSNVNARQMGASVDAGLGMEVLFNQNWGLDLRYVYLKNFNNNLAGISETGSVTYQNTSHNVLLSLVYRFGMTEAE
jgi:opacity protein-like surface antigen